MERCSSGSWTEATRIPVSSVVIINGKKKSKGLISIILSIPAACSDLSDSVPGSDTSSNSPDVGLSLIQLNFIILAILARSAIQDLHQHIYGTQLVGINSKADDTMDKDWLLILLRNQTKVPWDDKAEAALLEMREMPITSEVSHQQLLKSTITSRQSMDNLTEMMERPILLRSHSDSSQPPGN